MASSIQRQFTKLTVKGSGNDAQIQVILNDFEVADKTLSQLIESVRHWRDAWKNILSSSFGITTEYDALYRPIMGASDGHSRGVEQSSDQQLSRVAHIKEAYAELQTDLMEEINMMDSRIIKPASDAREHIKPLKKIIKQRDDKRLDFEKYQDRVNKASRKDSKTDREEMTFQRSQDDLARATEIYRDADDQIRDVLPPIIAACFALLPHLLAAQIMAQNTMLAQYYTSLHTFCGEHGFESPPPPMQEVISVWEADFRPIQQEVEAMDMIRKGKAVHTPMTLGNDGSGTKSISGFNLRNNLKSRTSSTTVPRLDPNNPPSPGRPSRPISRMSSSNTIPRIPSSTPRREENDEPEQRSGLLTPKQANFASRPPSGPGQDYFQSKPVRPTSSASTTPGLTPSYNGQPRMSPSLASSVASIAGKKKPPPPPPKRIASGVRETWVVAIYGFTGQEQGDLSFSEGDKIKVVKKTGSTDDWWEGEFRGHRGKFPANYCELVV